MISHLSEYREETAMLVMRLMLGILFVMQGYDKLVNIGVTETAKIFQQEIKIKFLPGWAYLFTSVYSCYIEFFGGIFLLFGLFTDISLVFLAGDLLLVALAMGLMNPVWDMKYVYPRFFILVLLLLLPKEWNLFSFDFLIFG
ncbi:MAG: DoxX family protein [Bacteroidota bacterium]